MIELRSGLHIRRLVERDAVDLAARRRICCDLPIDMNSDRVSYRALVEELRSERAQELARSTLLSVEEMAKKLGFQDVRSFRRAFKRWSDGRSPEAFRKDE